MSSRFFVPPEQIHPPKFTLLGSEARHAALVLRKKVGEEIEIFDGKDMSYRGCIDFISPERLEGHIVHALGTRDEDSAPVSLYQALIKGPRWDWLVEKACEVGAARLIPITTARTIVKPTHKAGVERWERIALAASKQSGRLRPMQISAPMTYSEALATLPNAGLALIPWEKEMKTTIREALKSAQPVSLFIGPEGGWEAAEIEFARRRGVIPVTIGKTLLRSETAGLVALAQVLSEKGVSSWM